jgi:hypothetical protein
MRYTKKQVAHTKFSHRMEASEGNRKPGRSTDLTSAQHSSRQQR